MVRSSFVSLARIGFALALSAAAGLVGAQTISYGNSPGGYPGNVSFTEPATTLQTVTPIDLIDWHFSGSVDFTFQTGASSGLWTYAPGGSVSMVVGDGFSGGIDLNGDSMADIMAGTTLFTGVLGTTTVRDRVAQNIECNPYCTGSDFDISATFTTSNLHAGYAAALGLPTGDYTGSFLFGIGSYTPGENLQIGWRQVSLDLIPQAQAPVPEPETYAMLLAGLGLIGGIARRRKQNS